MGCNCLPISFWIRSCRINNSDSRLRHPKQISLDTWPQDARLHVAAHTLYHIYQDRPKIVASFLLWIAIDAIYRIVTKRRTLHFCCRQAIFPSLMKAILCRLFKQEKKVQIAYLHFKIHIKSWTVIVFFFFLFIISFSAHGKRERIAARHLWTMEINYLLI